MIEDMEILKLIGVGHILVTLVYSTMGMIILMLAYKIFDLVNALDFTKELEKNNQALGHVISGFFIAIAIVIAAAVHG